jgi:tRNA A-37 threonylcarbamoyl transferase component Bud32
VTQQSVHIDAKLTEEILNFSKHIAGSNRITAACVYGDSALELAHTKAVVEVLLVIRWFQPRLLNYVKTVDEKTIVIVAVDEWVFERDVDRGFLGEALAWGLILPYLPLINEEYLHAQEVKLKKRLILELLENLVLDFPELSYEFCIGPEYFMYETMVSRVRLFPPMIYSVLNFVCGNVRPEKTESMLQGYRKALKELESAHIVRFSDDYVKMSEEFIAKARNPRVRLVNLSKTVPRRLFTSLLSVFPRILNTLSQNREMLFRLQNVKLEDAEIVRQIEVPEKYVFVPTASGLVPLANWMDIEAFARKLLLADKGSKVEVTPLGGILNDVYLVKASSQGKTKKAVVKRFKDWSSFKWFPLVLWSVGTRTFAVLGRSRLERECAMNHLLHTKHFSVPKILHVSTDQRLIFMEYVEGENIVKVIKRLANLKAASKKRKELSVIERVGRKLAKVHAQGITLGDTKPENIIIGKHGEICLMDLEQASRKGDMTWDVAEFLYYAGHDMPLGAETHTAELIAEAFIKGYLEAGGDTETIRKAGNPKYTKVFSVFTLPLAILAISNACKKAGKRRG